MKLTADQERAILAEYTGKLSAIAKKFCRGKSTSAEDCLQELYIVFLKHIRKAERAEDIAVLPMMDFKHTMCEQVLNSLPVTVPMRTGDFRRRIESIRPAEDLKDIAGTEPGYSEAEERVFFTEMLRGLSDRDRMIIDTMLSTGTMTEAARALGVNKSTVSRSLKRIRETYITEFMRDTITDGWNG